MSQKCLVVHPNQAATASFKPESLPLDKAFDSLSKARNLAVVMHRTRISWY